MILSLLSYGDIPELHGWSMNIVWKTFRRTEHRHGKRMDRIISRRSLFTFRN